MVAVGFSPRSRITRRWRRVATLEPFRRRYATAMNRVRPLKTARNRIQSGQFSAAGRVAPSRASLDANDVAGETDQDRAKVVRHARHVIFQMAEVAIPRELFRAILGRIGQLRLPTPLTD